jgi:hypothetical protein
MMQASAENQALSQDISALERKRQFLEQVVDITRARLKEEGAIRL